MARHGCCRWLVGRPRYEMEFCWGNQLWNHIVKAYESSWNLLWKLREIVVESSWNPHATLVEPMLGREYEDFGIPNPYFHVLAAGNSSEFVKKK